MTRRGSISSFISQQDRRSARNSYSNEVYGIIEEDRADDTGSLFPRKIGERQENLVKSGLMISDDRRALNNSSMNFEQDAARTREILISGCARGAKIATRPDLTGPLAFMSLPQYRENVSVNL